MVSVIDGRDFRSRILRGEFELELRSVFSIFILQNRSTRNVLGGVLKTELADTSWVDRTLNRALTSAMLHAYISDVYYTARIHSRMRKRMMIKLECTKLWRA
jgi:hypothetical protein